MGFTEEWFDEFVRPYAVDEPGGTLSLDSAPIPVRAKAANSKRCLAEIEPDQPEGGSRIEWQDRSLIWNLCRSRSLVAAKRSMCYNRHMEKRSILVVAQAVLVSAAIAGASNVPGAQFPVRVFRANGGRTVGGYAVFKVTGFKTQGKGGASCAKR